jgi:hypothetical protein
MYDSDWLDEYEDTSASYNATPNDFNFTDKDIPDELLKEADLKALHPSV